MYSLMDSVHFDDSVWTYFKKITNVENILKCITSWNIKSSSLMNISTYLFTNIDMYILPWCNIQLDIYEFIKKETWFWMVVFLLYSVLYTWDVLCTSCSCTPKMLYTTIGDAPSHISKDRSCNRENDFIKRKFEKINLGSRFQFPKKLSI